MRAKVWHAMDCMNVPLRDHAAATGLDVRDRRLQIAARRRSPGSITSESPCRRPFDQIEHQRAVSHARDGAGSPLFHVGRTRPIFGGMAKHPDHPRKPGKPAKSRTPRSGASRPEVQPIGPALAELLNPAINRGESGIGSSTGLQPPPDNSWDRRAGGEAAAHRARASTRSTRDDVAKRDASVTERDVSSPPQPSPARGERSSTSPASVKRHNPNLLQPITAPPPPSRRWIRNWPNNSASPPRRKTLPRWRGRRATGWRRLASPPPPMRWKR